MKNILDIDFFKDIEWKSVLKDILKFYIYLVIFYGMVIFLLWAHTHWVLENSQVDIENILVHSYSAEDATWKFNLEMYQFLGEQMGFYMFILVCFGVFFSIPPKNFGHVAMVTVLIFLINNFGFSEKSFVEYAFHFYMLTGFVLIPWILSLAWEEYKQKWTREKQ